MKIIVDRPVSSSGSPAPASQAAAGASGRTAVLAVVVSYEPDRDMLMQLVERLVGTAEVLIVDNSESEAGVTSAAAVGRAYGCAVLRNPRNMGVAVAQNLGLRAARLRGFRYALLLDQDSYPEAGTIDVLVRSLESLRASGERVAAVGASHVDPRNGSRYPFVRLRRVRMRKVWPEAGTSIACDMLISSGCLIALDTLDDIGEMDADLFIDYVDFEWCRRAASKGYRVFAVADARMHHTIGDQSFCALGRSFNLHGPLRQYYFIRNALLFMRKPYLSLRWRAHLAYRVGGQLVLFSVFAPERVRRLGWMLRGLVDGLRGRAGRLGGPDGLASKRPISIAATPKPAAAPTERAPAMTGEVLSAD